MISLDFGPDDRRPVGRLAMKERRVFFEWNAEAREGALDLSPFQLARRAGVIEGPREPFGGLHGLFADSVPDAWGQLLVDRALRRAGRNPATLSPLDRLSMVGAGGPGALVFDPDLSEPGSADPVDLDHLAREADALLADHDGSLDAAALDRLRALGGSSGGARPKVLLYRHPQTGAFRASADAQYEPWIVKFPARGDPPDTGALEYAYSMLAGAAGLAMQPCALAPSRAGSGWFATRRFDRTHGPQGWTSRLHMQSLSALLEADFRIPSVGYDSLIKAARLITGEEAEAEQAFRLAVFNVAVHNRDDHAKNVAFLMDPSGAWRLAPAYDLTFSDGPGGEHSMDVMGEGKAPERAHFLALAKTTSIRPRQAATIIDEVCAACSAAARVLGPLPTGAEALGRITNSVKRLRP